MGELNTTQVYPSSFSGSGTVAAIHHTDTFMQSSWGRGNGQSLFQLTHNHPGGQGDDLHLTCIPVYHPRGGREGSTQYTHTHTHPILGGGVCTVLNLTNKHNCNRPLRLGEAGSTQYRHQHTPGEAAPTSYRYTFCHPGS